MAVYADEVEIYKCQKHPSRRRLTGICHVCLRERLSCLCPDCAAVRPCYCTTSSDSSASSISAEPSLRRSRSLAVPFLRSKPSVDLQHSRSENSKTRSFWSFFKSRRGNTSKSNGVDNSRPNDMGSEKESAKEERKVMMRKSRSVAVTSDYEGVSSSSRRRSWHLPSPMKAFKQSKPRGGLVQEA